MYYFLTHTQTYPNFVRSCELQVKSADSYDILVNILEAEAVIYVEEHMRTGENEKCVSAKTECSGNKTIWSKHCVSGPVKLTIIREHV